MKRNKRTSDTWSFIAIKCLILLTFVGCARLNTSTSSTQVVMSRTDQVEVYSTAVRHLLTSKKITPQSWPIIFIDPVIFTVSEPLPDILPTSSMTVPMELVERLEDLAPRVELQRRVSVIQERRGRYSVIGGGIWLGLTTIEPQNDGTVVLFVDYYVSDGNSALYRLQLSHQGTSWLVQQAVIRRIS